MVESDEAKVESTEFVVGMKNARVESDAFGFHSNAPEFQSAESQVESDAFGVGPKQARVELTLIGVRPKVFVVRLKQCGGGPKKAGGESDEFGIQSADARFTSRARR